MKNPNYMFFLPFGRTIYTYICPVNEKIKTFKAPEDSFGNFYIGRKVINSSSIEESILYLPENKKYITVSPQHNFPLFREFTEMEQNEFEGLLEDMDFLGSGL